MNTYLMRIKEKFISSISVGQKTHEYRLYDNERRKIKCNDRIVLVSRSNPSNYINVRVSSIEVYKSWEEALVKYWDQDFKNIYTDLNSAIKECNKFYDQKNVEKYGIVVFGIIPMQYKLQYKLEKSRILLDTNIIIERESLVSKKDNIANKVMLSLKHLTDLNCNFFYSEESKKEISKYENEAIRNSVLSKLDSCYSKLQENKSEYDDFFKNRLMEFSENSNSSVDNWLLFQLYKDRCDYLYTEDLGILNKARKLYLQDRIITSNNILSRINETNNLFKAYKSSFISLVHFKDVNLNDVFFKSLKEDYRGFENWFRKKANELCYVYEKDDGIKGFLYLKVEDENEDYSDFEKPFLEKKKRLKVGTFKIISTGLRLGERFIQIIVDNCLNKKLDEIYVTLFENKREEVSQLKELLENWGFEKYTYKFNGELVLVKKIVSFDDKKSIKANYPLHRNNPNYFFLPIKPLYHKALFPDLKLKIENNESKEMACNYALEKNYITSFNKSVNWTIGDVLLIYRMGEEDRIKKYASCVTGIAVLEDIKKCNSIGEMLALVKNKSVFNEAEVKDLFNRNYRTIITLVYIKPLNKKVILETLREKGIVEQNGGARILDKIGENKYNDIIKESEL